MYSDHEIVSEFPGTPISPLPDSRIRSGNIFFRACQDFLVPNQGCCESLDVASEAEPRREDFGFLVGKQCLPRIKIVLWHHGSVGDWAGETNFNLSC